MVSIPIFFFFCSRCQPCLCYHISWQSHVMSEKVRDFLLFLITDFHENRDWSRETRFSSRFSCLNFHFLQNLINPIVPLKSIINFQCPPNFPPFSIWLPQFSLFDVKIRGHWKFITDVRGTIGLINFCENWGIKIEEKIRGKIGSRFSCNRSQPC